MTAPRKYFPRGLCGVSCSKQSRQGMQEGMQEGMLHHPGINTLVVNKYTVMYIVLTITSELWSWSSYHQPCFKKLCPLGLRVRWSPSESVDGYDPPRVARYHHLLQPNGGGLNRVCLGYQSALRRRLARTRSARGSSGLVR